MKKLLISILFSLLFPIQTFASDIITAIIFQSNASMWWQAVGTGVYTPASNTFMWNGTAWVPPINSLVTLANELNTRTGQTVRIYPCAIGGTGLLKNNSNSPMSNWLDQIGPSPLTECLSMIAAAGINPNNVYGVGTENDAISSAVTIPTIATYQSALEQLHTIFSSAFGQTPDTLPMLISPLGNAAAQLSLYPYSNAELSAQYGLTVPQQKYSGLIVGPEYYDLPVGTDLIHLTEAGRNTFAIRAADAIAFAMGYPRPIIVPPLAWTTIFSASLNVNSAPNFAGKSGRSPTVAAGAAYTQVRVTLNASTGGALTLDHASIGIQSSGLNTTTTPIPLLFSGSVSVTIPSGGSIVSDPLSFSLGSTDIPLIIIDINASGTQNFRYQSTGSGTAYYNTSGGSYNQSSPSGFTADTTERYFSVSKIEAQ